MATLIPKNWSSFQHYKDRAPAWIKLHGDLLDDFEFHCLPLASKALAPMLWLLASKYDGGKIPLDYTKIAFRLRMSVAELEEAAKSLISSGFFVIEGELEQTASTALAQCLPREEKRREREEGEKEADTPSAPAKPPRTTKPKKTRLPDDFGISLRVLAWANERNIDRLEQHLEYFAGWARAKGAEYLDWDEALMNAIRGNWAKLPAAGPQSSRPTLADHNRAVAQEALADLGFFGDSHA